MNSTGSLSKPESRSSDVVIIGAGIIGLTIARQFILESDLSVTVIDAAVPCSGATGADMVVPYEWASWRHPPRTNSSSLNYEWAKIQLMDFIHSLANTEFGIRAACQMSFASRRKYARIVS